MAFNREMQRLLVHDLRSTAHLVAVRGVQHLGHTPPQGAHNVTTVLSSTDNGTNNRDVIIRHLDLPVSGAS